MKKKLTTKGVRDIREILRDTLEELLITGNYNDIEKTNFNIYPSDLGKVIFEKIKDRERRDLRIFTFDPVLIPFLMKVVDFTGVSFDDVDVRCIDFTGSKGVKINPKTVYDKSLWGTKLSDVEIVGSFDGVDTRETDFTGSIILVNESVDNSCKKRIRK